MEQQFFEEERNLSTTETTIMKAIWEDVEDISIPDLTERLRTKYGKNYARTTIGTFLKRMSNKGFVKVYRQGKISFVHAIRKEEEYREKLLSEETAFWFKGSIASLVSALCSERKLTKDEISEIRSILDDIPVSDNEYISD